jgi:hypothetical protein
MPSPYLQIYKMDLPLVTSALAPPASHARICGKGPCLPVCAARLQVNLVKTGIGAPCRPGRLAQPRHRSTGPGELSGTQRSSYGGTTRYGYLDRALPAFSPCFLAVLSRRTRFLSCMDQVICAFLCLYLRLCFPSFVMLGDCAG